MSQIYFGINRSEIRHDAAIAAKQGDLVYVVKSEEPEDFTYQSDRLANPDGTLGQGVAFEADVFRRDGTPMPGRKVEIRLVDGKNGSFELRPDFKPKTAESESPAIRKIDETV